MVQLAFVRMIRNSCQKHASMMCACAWEFGLFSVSINVKIDWTFKFSYFVRTCESIGIFSGWHNNIDRWHCEIVVVLVVSAPQIHRQAAWVFFFLLIQFVSLNLLVLMPFNKCIAMCTSEFVRFNICIKTIIEEHWT